MFGIYLEEIEEVEDQTYSCFKTAVRHYKFWAANYIYYKFTQECLPELVLFKKDKDPSMQMRW
jgi:hypothetical protein